MGLGSDDVPGYGGDMTDDQTRAKATRLLELHRAPAPADVVPEEQITGVPVDELGRFTVADLRPGLVRIVVHREDLPPLATDWFRVD